MFQYLTTADVADLLHVETWRVRRLFEDGTLKEPGRLGNQRAIPSSMLPAIIDSLRNRGWLRDTCSIETATVVVDHVGLSGTSQP